MNNYLNSLLSFQGRVTRKTYWLVGLTLYCAPWVTLMIFITPILFIPGSPDNIITSLTAITLLVIAFGVFMTVSIFTFIASLALILKRAHDIGSEGWIWLFGTLLIGIPALVLGCIRGNEDTNKFGKAPNSPINTL